MSGLAIRLLLAGGFLLIVFGAGWSAATRYSSVARNWRHCQTETARRNAAIERVTADEEARRLEEAAARSTADAEFARRSASLQQCLLTAETADALNLLRE